MGYRTDSISQAMERYALDSDTYSLKVKGNQGDSNWVTISHAELEAIRCLLALKDD